MEEKTLKQIADRGQRIRELDEIDRQLSFEAENIQGRREAIALERRIEVAVIQALEMTLDDSVREKSWTAQHRNKKPGDQLSVAVLMEQVLEKYQEGLKTPGLLAEVRKIGFQTDSKDPIAVLTSTLHRRKDIFARGTAGHRGRRDIRWCLKKYAPAPLQNVVQLKASR